MTLVEAIEAWRADKSLANAARVDDLSAELELETPPKKKLHRWWVARARTYDPVVATTLLAYVHADASGSNVSWRTIHLRGTPLVTYLRELGDAVVPRDWLNLIDRIGLMLAWPDDPRVAMRLAQLVHEAPLRPVERLGRRERHVAAPVCRAAILERVLAIGDPRAIEVVGRDLARIDPDARARIEAAVAALPAPREAAIPEDAELAGLWEAIADAPDDLARRLVLADALIERGDPRGEMIALQCAPLIAIEDARARGETIDASGLFGHSAERIAKLIDANWHRWLGEVGLVASRSSKFRGGLLGDLVVGTATTPPWAWDRAARHRELSAVYRVIPMSVSPSVYVRFILALRRVPRWVALGQDHLDELRALGRTLSATGVILIHRTARRPLDALVRETFAIAPALAYLALDDLIPSDLRRLRTFAFELSRLKQLRLTMYSPVGAEEAAIVDELRALPFVRIDAYGWA